MVQSTGGRHADRAGPVANTEMAAAWAEEGQRWVAQAESYDATVQRHSERLLQGARIASSERVLDIGCGCGATTRAAARAASLGVALGLDISPAMIGFATARARDEGLANVQFELADAQVHPFREEYFDVVISRFGAMFFNDPLAAFLNVGRGMRKHGRLLLLAWQALQNNEWLIKIRESLAMGRDLPEPPIGRPGPFGLADAVSVRDLLGQAGFRDVGIHDVHEPVYFGRDADDALVYVRTTGPVVGLLDDLDDSTTERALENLHALLAAHQTPQGILFDSHAWLITARRSSMFEGSR